MQGDVLACTAWELQHRERGPPGGGGGAAQRGEGEGQEGVLAANGLAPDLMEGSAAVGCR